MQHATYCTTRSGISQDMRSRTTHNAVLRCSSQAERAASLKTERTHASSVLGHGMYLAHALDHRVGERPRALERTRWSAPTALEAHGDGTERTSVRASLALERTTTPQTASLRCTEARRTQRRTQAGQAPSVRAHTTMYYDASSVTSVLARRTGNGRTARPQSARNAYDMICEAAC